MHCRIVKIQLQRSEKNDVRIATKISSTAFCNDSDDICSKVIYLEDGSGERKLKVIELSSM